MDLSHSGGIFMYGVYMTWKDRLQDASFRGVPFKVEEESAGTGRRVKHTNTRTATNPIPKTRENHFPPVHHSLCGGR